MRSVGPLSEKQTAAPGSLAKKDRDKRERENKTRSDLRRGRGSKTDQGPDVRRRSKEAPFSSHEILRLVVEPEGADESESILRAAGHRYHADWHRSDREKRRERERKINAFLLFSQRDAT